VAVEPLGCAVVCGRGEGETPQTADAYERVRVASSVLPDAAQPTCHLVGLLPGPLADPS
jgi:hypothetical protein